MTDPGAPAQNPADMQNLQDEVARLRAELADARSAPQPTQPIVVQQPPRHTFRWIITVLLAVLLVVLTPMAVAGSWARSVVFDTDRYVATVGSDTVYVNFVFHWSTIFRECRERERWERMASRALGWAGSCSRWPTHDTPTNTATSRRGSSPTMF